MLSWYDGGGGGMLSWYDGGGGGEAGPQGVIGGGGAGLQGCQRSTPRTCRLAGGHEATTCCPMMHKATPWCPMMPHMCINIRDASAASSCSFREGFAFYTTSKTVTLRYTTVTCGVFYQ